MLTIGSDWKKLLKLPRLALIVISILAGIVAFCASEYRPLTLVLEAKTLKKGLGTVTVMGHAASGSSSQRFKVRDDQGAKEMYVIELPSSSIQSIAIAPLAPYGQFALERVILSNDNDSYSWDELGHCSLLAKRNGLLIRESCNAASPIVTMTEDASVLISTIPESESENSMPARIMVSLIFVVSVFGGGIWVLRPCAEMARCDRLAHYCAKGAWLSIAMLFAYQLYMVFRYAVDIPTTDEWIYFSSDGLINGLTLNWVLGNHNEHRIVLTKLLAWLNLKLFGLNFVYQCVFNYLIFGGLIVAVVGFKNKVLRKNDFVLFPLFIIFLLSPISQENHLWAFQSQFHLVLLFSLLMLYHVYRSELTGANAILFSMYAVFAIYTLSAGVIFVAVYLLCVAIYIIAGIAGNRLNRDTGLKFLLIAAGCCCVVIYLWSLGYATPAFSTKVLPPTPKIYPSDFRFWDHYLNIVSYGFGFESEQILPGILCLTLVTLPPIILLINKDARWQHSTWFVLTAIAGILTVLAAISVGRAGFGTAKMSRYAEIGSLLIPYAAIGWWLVMKEGPQRYAMLSFLWIFCFVSYLDDWSMSSYAESKQIKLYNLECVEGYFNGIGNGICQGEVTSPADLDRAREMGAKFARQFRYTKGGGR